MPQNVRQPSDCVCYDAEGNILRVIVARKRTSPKAEKLANARKAHALRGLKKGGK